MIAVETTIPDANIPVSNVPVKEVPSGLYIGTAMDIYNLAVDFNIQTAIKTGVDTGALIATAKGWAISTPLIVIGSVLSIGGLMASLFGGKKKAKYKATCYAYVVKEGKKAKVVIDIKFWDADLVNGRQVTESIRKALQKIVKVYSDVINAFPEPVIDSIVAWLDPVVQAIRVEASSASHFKERLKLQLVNFMGAIGARWTPKIAGIVYAYKQGMTIPERPELYTIPKKPVSQVREERKEKKGQISKSPEKDLKTMGMTSNLVLMSIPVLFFMIGLSKG